MKGYGVSQRMSGSARLNFPVVALLMLLVAGFIGYRAVQYDPAVVLCGDDVMAPGDQCLSTGNGGGTYAEVQAFRERNHRVDQIVALGSGAFAIYLLGRWAYRRATARSAAGPGPST